MAIFDFFTKRCKLLWYQLKKKSRIFFLSRLLKQTVFTLMRIPGGPIRPNYRIDRVDFPFYSIEFVARGKGSVVLKNKEYNLSAGRVFSYGPDIAHMITSEANDPLVKYFVDFVGSDALKTLRKYSLAPGHVVQVASPEIILQIFEDLIRNGQNDSPYTLLLCKAILEQLILKIAESSIFEQSRTSASFFTYQNSRDIIQRNFKTLQSLEEIAEQCHIDSAYLCRLFKRFDNRSPYQYLMRMKMNLAAQRLQLPDASVKEIAFELGFSDPFHFSRVFKRIFGVSPSVFKNLR
jgi:AraC-like DNA-binding protein